MSVERLRFSLLARVVVLKAVGDVFQGVSEVADAVGTLFRNLETTLHLAEADSAIQYEALTGVDLARVGDLGSRYDEVKVEDDDFEA